jgi:hypothetical protein
MLRMSEGSRCWEAELVDNVSKRSTTGFLEQRALDRFEKKRLPIELLGWLDNPVGDWNFRGTF